jgi:hypothetical protein
MKSIWAFLMVGILFLTCGCTSTADEDMSSVELLESDTIDYWEELYESNTSKENFADKYYYSILTESLSGDWTQQDVTYMLEKCIQQDLDKNGEQSKLQFAKNDQVLFFYVIDTSTGIENIRFLIEKRDESRFFPDFEFAYFTAFVRYCENFDWDDVKTYKLEMTDVEVIKFKDQNDFIKFINKECFASVFFERGWLEIK